MAPKKEKLVSILGSSYFQPIADILERWLSRRKAPRPNKVQSGFYEHGYAATIAPLLVAMFESYVSRLRFIQRPHRAVTNRHALDVLFGIYPTYRHKKALMDVYVLRDAIIHNHLWEIDYSWSGSPTMKLHTATMDAAFGDKKFNQRVNLKIRRTKAIGLNVVPTRIDRHDVLKVFNAVWQALLFLESRSRMQCYVSHECVRFRGRTRPFGEIVDEIRTPSSAENPVKRGRLD